MEQAFDFVGDVHGHSQALEKLLITMGYQRRSGGFLHTERKLIFIGDLIDRGPDQKRTLSIARTMVDNGHAIVLMGNHEFNAICYATANGKGNFLRPHNAKNNSQHKNFLLAFPCGGDTHKEAIDFFQGLPLWLETNQFRAVHACWHAPSQIALLPYLDHHFCIQDEQLYASYAQSQSAAYRAIEILLKGPEVRLPDGQSFNDADGNLRHEARVYWWHLPDHPEKAFLENVDPNQLKKASVQFIYPKEAKPLLFGHYWITGDYPGQCRSNNAFCLDWSIAKNGRLFGLRWNGNFDTSEWFYVK